MPVPPKRVLDGGDTRWRLPNWERGKQTATTLLTLSPSPSSVATHAVLRMTNPDSAFSQPVSRLSCNPLSDRSLPSCLCQNSVPSSADGQLAYPSSPGEKGPLHFFRVGVGSTLDKLQPRFLRPGFECWALAFSGPRRAFFASTRRVKSSQLQTKPTQRPPSNPSITTLRRILALQPPLPLMFPACLNCDYDLPPGSFGSSSFYHHRPFTLPRPSARPHHATNARVLSPLASPVPQPPSAAVSYPTFSPTSPPQHRNTATPPHLGDGCACWTLVDMV